MKKTQTKYPNIFTYKTSDGKKYYYVRKSFVINGRRQEITKGKIKTLSDARYILAEIEKKISDGDYHINKNMTVDQYWEKYYRKKTETGQWAPDTEANKISIYNNHFKEKFGNIKLKDLDRDSYELYINSMLKTKSRHTVRQSHGIFMAIINDAVACGNLRQNILQKIYIGESYKPAQNKKLTLEQFKIIDQAAKKLFDDYDYTLIRLTYFGLRVSEVAGIQLKTISTRSDGRVELLPTSSRTRKRDGKNSVGQETMKTRGSSRTIVLDLETSQLIQKAVKRSHEIAKSVGRILSADDYLFLVHYTSGINRGKPVPPDRLSYLFGIIEDKTGIYVRPHMMRHFFATQGVLAGVPIAHMAAALGHTTSYMTEKYTHIQEEISASVTDSFIRAIK